MKGFYWSALSAGRAVAVITGLITIGLVSGCGDSSTDSRMTAAAPPEAVMPYLPPVNPDAITVSGISSGAAVAQQLHFAYADVFSGAGLIAGVPYGCSEGDLKLALGRCIGKEEGALPVDAYLAALEQAALNGEIASPELLMNDRAWVFHGELDTAVGQKVSEAVYGLYTGLLPEGQQRYVSDIPAAHLFPSLDSGAPCDKSISPWVGACNYDGAGELLQFLYTGLEEPNTAQRNQSPNLAVVELPGAGPAGLADEALLFVPDSCPADGCRLHVVLHGCLQGREQLGNDFAELAGYLPWGRANGIVLAFPQVKPQPRNPLGCWDWWGYTSDDFLSRDAPQLKVISDWVVSLAGE